MLSAVALFRVGVLVASVVVLVVVTTLRLATSSPDSAGLQWVPVAFAADLEVASVDVAGSMVVSVVGEAVMVAATVAMVVAVVVIVEGTVEAEVVVGTVGVDLTLLKDHVVPQAVAAAAVTVEAAVGMAVEAHATMTAATEAVPVLTPTWSPYLLVVVVIATATLEEYRVHGTGIRPDPSAPMTETDQVGMTTAGLADAIRCAACCSAEKQTTPALRSFRTLTWTNKARCCGTSAISYETCNCANASADSTRTSTSSLTQRGFWTASFDEERKTLYHGHCNGESGLPP